MALPIHKAMRLWRDAFGKKSGRQRDGEKLSCINACLFLSRSTKPYKKEVTYHTAPKNMRARILPSIFSKSAYSGTGGFIWVRTTKQSEKKEGQAKWDECRIKARAPRDGARVLSRERPSWQCPSLCERAPRPRRACRRRPRSACVLRVESPTCSRLFCNACF